jgi:hypothetical protein
VAEGPDRQQLLTALTTEHFGLAGARAQATGESSARAALYISAVSSTLVALGFIGQISDVGDTFDVFALTALPTLYILGLFTFVRTVENGVEDLMMGRAINRIRNYYLEIAGEEARYFMLSGHDDALGVMRNMGVSLQRRQQFFTTGSMIAVINSVVGGAAVAIAVGTFTGAPLGICSAAGALAAVISLARMLRIENRMYQRWAASPRSCFLRRQLRRAGRPGASSPVSLLNRGWTKLSAVATSIFSPPSCAGG